MEAAKKQSNTAERLFMLFATVMVGGLLGSMGVPPFPQISASARTTMQFVGGMVNSRPGILIPISHEGTGLVSRDAAKSQPGLTLIQGTMPGGPQVRLLDHEGNEVHRWTVDFFAIWPDADQIIPARRIPASQNNYITHGMWPMPDGSLIVNLTGLGSARIDACSNTVWRTQQPLHHSVTAVGNDTFWIPGHILASETPQEYMPDGWTPQEIDDAILTDHYYHDSVVLVSADGDILREMSVLKAIHDAGLESALYQSHTETITDATHINDIEVVTPALAERLPQVEAGDLLVSLRAMNMLAILDKDDGALKWHQQGPWVRQHDPDIMPDGTIELFNNRATIVNGHTPGSQIMRLVPETGETSVVFPRGSADAFNSDIMGMHQPLENGNRLIVESRAGRAFEVTPAGEVVWDYRLPFDDEFASNFSFGIRVPNDYFTMEFPQCSN